MKLLLVDDNARIRKLMRSIYSPHFDEVIECDDGEAAVLAFDGNNPDWVVMDINLPTGKAGMKEMDGIEATEKIITAYPDARIIIVSQFNDESTIDAAMNAGAVEFVSKENLSKVIEVINKNNKEQK